jgi:hypothetical protein
MAVDTAPDRLDDPGLDEIGPLSDDELAALALAADPDLELGGDAVAVCLFDPGGDPLLPEWYLPAASGGVRPRRGWRRKVALTMIVSFLVVDACGLCCTYGALVLA